jgi:transposase
MGRQRRAFSHEFKAEAIRMMRESGKPIAQIARELGVRADMLRAWKQQAEGSVGVGSEAVREEPKGVVESEEIRRLKRELEVVRQERDFLKKAAAYFAKESP